MLSVKQGLPVVRLARSGDVGQLSKTLALAFYSDPVYEWFFPHAGSRIEKMQRLFAVFLERLVPSNMVFTTRELEGASLWIPPSRAISNWRSAKQNLRILWALGNGVLRSIWWWLAIESKQPRYPHWELFLIGVVPESQGKGLGRALLQPMLDRCDGEQVPIYLDTGNRKTVAFYQRYGFEVKRKIVLPKGPTVFQMVRTPK